jgi:acyl-CoA reductase-like NAD-dependent aldehyde dehydrogenase
VTPADPILAEESAELAASAAMYLRELERAQARWRRRDAEIRARASAKLAELGRANNDCKENPS